MKKLCLVAIIILGLASCGNQSSTAHPDDLSHLYNQLDATIAESSNYEDIKEGRIARLRDEYYRAADVKRRVDLANQLAEEFNAYNADSTLFYINQNLSRPEITRFPGEYTRLLIRRGDVFAHAGLFSDALDVMRSIPRDSLGDDLLEPYYSTYCALYQYLSEYTDEHASAVDYTSQRAVYSDSLQQILRPGSFNHMTYVMTEMARTGHEQEAIEAISQNLEQYKSGSREFSILASTLAYIYKTTGNDDEYRKYLTLSAISDAQGAVKENMSFRELATVMFESGDVERANRYLKKSIADANFYSAMMRNAQSSKMLPVIDDAYSALQNRLTHRQRILMGVLAVLAIVLIFALLFMRKQFKAVRRANKRVSDANEALSLKSAQLEQANMELRTFNRTKEQYAGLFMEYCSTAISSLQHYQQSLRVLTAQGANRAALQKKLESSDIADQMLKNFYVKFDEAILNIYPAFVEKFNQLLQPDEQVVLKPGELLNTELRLYALVRLGIDDSAKIAQFLRCSLSTIYTYRSKMRKRALRPDRFEDEVKNMA
ncbi:MAG: hypothetical protein K2G64_00785 [Muribaculaceae bacterium]|nr:hypothetical protein [Muribaculaceae bacterium]MDE7393894.1 hypothetical protein [Muribaculaceae bacterium]